MSNNNARLFRETLRDALASGAAPPCPEPETLEALAEGLLRGKEQRAAQAHVQECPACAVLLSPLWKMAAFVRRCHSRPARAAWDYVRGKMTDDQREDFRHHLLGCVSCALWVQSFSRVPFVAPKPAPAVAEEAAPASPTAFSLFRTNAVRQLSRAYAVAVCSLLLVVGNVTYLLLGSNSGLALSPVRKGIRIGEQGTAAPATPQDIMRVLFGSPSNEAELADALDEAEVLVLHDPSVKGSAVFHYVLHLRYKDLARLASTKERHEFASSRSKEERDIAVSLGFHDERKALLR